MHQLTWPKAVLWAFLALPAVGIAVQYAAQPDLRLDELLHPTGEWSARWMILALMFTPLSRIWPNSRLVQWLLRHRRAFGVSAFSYALLHLVIYVADMETVANMVAEIGALGIWTGWLALLLLLPLAITSNERAVRALGRGWKRLQRLAYPAALLVLIHWVFIHNGLIAALINFAPLILLELIRIVKAVQRSSSHRSLKESYP